MKIKTGFRKVLERFDGVLDGEGLEELLEAFQRVSEVKDVQSK